MTLDQLQLDDGACLITLNPVKHTCPIMIIYIMKSKIHDPFAWAISPKNSRSPQQCESNVKATNTRAYRQSASIFYLSSIIQTYITAQIACRGSFGSRRGPQSIRKDCSRENDKTFTGRFIVLRRADPQECFTHSLRRLHHVVIPFNTYFKIYDRRC